MSINASPSGSGSSGGSGGSSSGGGGGGGPCGACKFLRRKCVPGCIFAPYFDSEQGASHFAAVHRVFGASNVSKLLLNIPVHKRLDAVITICYEAQSRLRDPVYGCVSHIFALQQQVANLQAELSYVHGHLGPVELPQPQPPPPPQAFPATDVPTNSASSMSGTYDLSSLWDPMVQAAWAAQQRSIDPGQYAGSGPSSTVIGGGGGRNSGGGDDFQALARELLLRDGSPREVPLPSPNASSTPSLSKRSS